MTAGPLALLAGFVVMMAAAALQPSSANAQGFYYNAPYWAPPHYRQQRPSYRGRRYYQPRQQPRPQVRRPPAKTPKAPTVSPAWHPDKSSKEPIMVIVSLASQKLAVYQGDKRIVTSRVSSGKKGYATPTGVFSILGKSRWHRSNIYSGAPMPFMQRLTWSGIALHASNSVPDYPASHGCVRLPNSFAHQLFSVTRTGGHVIVTNKADLAPQEIVHEKLFNPEYPPPRDFDQVEAERVLASDGVKVEARKQRDSDPVRILITRRNGREQLMDVQRLLNRLEFAAGEIDGLMGPDTAQSIRRFQEAHGEAYGLTPNGLVTDDLIHAIYAVAGKPEPKSGHIYVRQNFKQLFDAPITIQDSDLPLGNHLITAQHFELGGNKDVRWLYVSMNRKVKPRREVSAERNSGTATDQPEIQSPVPMPLATVEEALDRIEIPAALRQRIGEILTPGSSIAISDDGLSSETHPKGTDFVLLTRD